MAQLSAPADRPLLSVGDFAELITASPAVGFLSKSDLSATGILDLPGGRGTVG
jgi:hypothetical protein